VSQTGDELYHGGVDGSTFTFECPRERYKGRLIARSQFLLIGLRKAGDCRTFTGELVIALSGAEFLVRLISDLLRGLANS
jgi:hypothetical protein